MKKVALAEIKDQLSKFLHDAEQEEILITRHGKPAGVLIGFGSEDEWFDYKLENDPRFLSRVDAARSSLRSGGGSRIEEIVSPKTVKPNKRMQRTASKGADRSRRGRKGGR
ncbi:MAG: type II toxin-antitoxin system Phd/YefM family antitoxin [bacterium]